jgi:hypothetical protein
VDACYVDAGSVGACNVDALIVKTDVAEDVASCFSGERATPA